MSALAMKARSLTCRVFGHQPPDFAAIPWCPRCAETLKGHASVTMRSDARGPFYGDLTFRVHLGEAMFDLRDESGSVVFGSWVSGIRRIRLHEHAPARVGEQPNR